MTKSMKTYEVDIDLYGIDTMFIKARTRPEARRKAIARLKRSLNRYIQQVNMERVKQ